MHLCPQVIALSRLAICHTYIPLAYKRDSSDDSLAPMPVGRIDG